MLRFLRVPWTAKRSNQSILKEISPEYSFEGLMLKLKLQYFGHLLWRADSLEKTLMLGKIEGGRRRGQQRMRWLDGITGSMDMSWWWTGRPGMLQSMGSQRVGHDWATELKWTVLGLISLWNNKLDDTVLYLFKMLKIHFTMHYFILCQSFFCIYIHTDTQKCSHK